LHGISDERRNPGRVRFSWRGMLRRNIKTTDKAWEEICLKALIQNNGSNGLPNELVTGKKYEV